MKKILITGSQGFIGAGICDELLNHGYEVIGVDNYSRYGLVTRTHDHHPNFTFCFCNILHKDNFINVLDFYKPNIIVSSAAKIGGIGYTNNNPYSILSANEQMTNNIFEGAIKLYDNKILEKIVIISSSMVFENACKFPTKEMDLYDMPPPQISYSFQKLSSEYFAKSAFNQHGLPYQIARPSNCVGVGEDQTLKEFEYTSGDIKLMMSHVLPDLITKILKGQNPLHIFGDGSQIRCFTNVRDIARGIRLVIETKYLNEDFNISTTEATNILNLAKLVWENINDTELQIVFDPPFEHDIQKIIQDVSKSEKLLNFTTKISLRQSVQETINYFKNRKIFNE